MNAPSKKSFNHVGHDEDKDKQNIFKGKKYERVYNSVAGKVRKDKGHERG